MPDEEEYTNIPPEDNHLDNSRNRLTDVFAHHCLIASEYLLHLTLIYLSFSFFLNLNWTIYWFKIFVKVNDFSYTMISSIEPICMIFIYHICRILGHILIFSAL
jgi:hypothetical protein